MGDIAICIDRPKTTDIQHLIDNCLIRRFHSDVTGSDTIYIFYKYNGCGYSVGYFSFAVAKASGFPEFTIFFQGVENPKPGSILVFANENSGDRLAYKFSFRGQVLITVEDLASILAFDFTRITVAGSTFEHKCYPDGGAEGVLLIKWMLWKIHEVSKNWQSYLAVAEEIL